MRFEIDTTTAIVHSAELPAAVVEPSSTNARQLLDSGIHAAQNGNRSEARVLLLKCTELDPEIESAWLWLASISEYPEELLDYLDHVLSINPQNQRALEWKAATNSLLSKTFVQRGADAADSNDKELASEHFVKALEYDKRNAVAWMWLATLSESDEGKLLYIEKALSIDPDLEDAVTAYNSTRQQIVANKLAHAKSAAVAGKLEEANEVLKAIVGDDPTCTEAWKLYAIFAVNISEKIEAYRRLVDLDQTDLASAAALESLENLATEIPVVETVEPRTISAESDGLSMAIAEVVRYESDAAPEKTPTEELEMPEGVEEAFGVSAYTATEFENSIDADALQIAQDDGAENLGADEVSGRDWQHEESTFAAEAYIVDVLESESAEATEVPGDAYLEAAYERANFDSDIEVNAVPTAANEDLFSQPEYSDLAFDADTSNGFSGHSSFEHHADEPDITVETPQSFEEAEPVNFANVEYQQESATEYNVNGYFPGAAEPWNESRSEASFDGGIPMPGFDLDSPDKPSANPYATVVVESDRSAANSVACPYCGTANDSVAVSCQACMAVLTLSDLEMLLSNSNVDRAILNAAVESLEMERTLREFGERELTTLGIGHLNLRNFDTGYAYLEQASRINPTNVVLTGQVNILHIRLAEIKAKEEMQGAMAKGKTILVVDDSPTILRLIAGKLEKCGHDVYCSENGEEAMEWLKGMVPDLVLLDINMPKMDGYQVCKLIRSNVATKDVPVVMISGKDGFFDKVRGRMAGSSGYITKPFGPETLMKIVEGYLQGQPLPVE